MRTFALSMLLFVAVSAGLANENYHRGWWEFDPVGLLLASVSIISVCCIVLNIWTNR